MDAERLRAFLHTLPNIAESSQWTDRLALWVGDKSIGGKMFAVLNFEPGGNRVISYAAGPERYYELLETEGLLPAPYSARNYWVAATHWHVFRDAGWHEELRKAHALTLAKLPPRTRAILALPKFEQQRVIAGLKQPIAAKAASIKAKAAKKHAAPHPTVKGTKPLRPKPKRS